MKIRSLILGSIAAAGLFLAPGGFDFPLTFIDSGPTFARHRPAGYRTRRRWKRARASGRR